MSIIGIILIGIGTILLHEGNRKKSKESTDSLSKQISDQQRTIDDQKETIKKLQFPIPDKFEGKVYMDYEPVNDSSTILKERFQYFDNMKFYLTIYETDDKESDDVPAKSITLKSSIVNISEGFQARNKKKSNSTRIAIDKTTEFKIEFNTTAFSSLMDFCGKKMKVVVHGLSENELKPDFRIREITLKSPQGYKMKVKRINLKDRTADLIIEDKCWQ